MFSTPLDPPEHVRARRGDVVDDAERLQRVPNVLQLRLLVAQLRLLGLVELQQLLVRPERALGVVPRDCSAGWVVPAQRAGSDAEDGRELENLLA